MGWLLRFSSNQRFLTYGKFSGSQALARQQSLQQHEDTAQHQMAVSKCSGDGDTPLIQGKKVACLEFR